MQWYAFSFFAEGYSCGGKQSRQIKKGIHINGADEILVIWTAATSFNGFDKCPACEGKDEKMLAGQYLAKASIKSFDELKDSHIRDFASYFERVSLQLTDTVGSKVNAQLPSDFRLKLYSYGNYDPQLEELLFQYGRYLLISSSRLGGTAANLQGIWNKDFRPPWSSNYTININTEMNYWLAETTNLSEMHTPLLSWIKDLSKAGRATAKEFYHAKGWVAHHNSDIWGLSNPVGIKEMEVLNGQTGQWEETGYASIYGNIIVSLAISNFWQMRLILL